jgi:tetratricopeptide (TPR) repeat protein
MNRNDGDPIGLEEPAEEESEFMRLANRAIGLLSLPVKRLIDAWLDSLSAHSRASSELLERVESQCGSDEELGWALHLEALVLDHAGDTYQAIDKAQRCLELTSRIDHRQLEADVLVHMGKMYRALGHKDLGAEYARAAERMRSGAHAAGIAPGNPDSQ